VAEQILNHAEIRAVLQQVTGEGVAKHVRAHARGRNARRPGNTFEVAREGTEKQRLLDLAEERGFVLDERRAQRAVAAGHANLLEERIVAGGGEEGQRVAAH